MGEGREGDWECGGCNNRNYAFRSFCNICKQPRLLVDSKTPAGSKWLPRIGDWICSGCTNNNYASREKCKKCGQPKEVAAMPAMVMSGASFPTHPHYFSRVRGGLLGNGDTQHSVPLVSSWSLGLGGPDRYGSQSNSGWVGDLGPGFPYANIINQPHIAPKGWRNGDWICNCGFHNYSSRAQCKKCNGSVPPALGTKRLATEDFVQDWDNKRLNAGQKDTQINGLLPLHPGFGQMAVSDPKAGLSLPYTVGSSAAFPYLQMHTKLSQSSSTTIIGKGAKQWRDGDWMCTNCNNHNYASRTQCNKCKTEREAVPQSDSKE